MRDKTNIRHIWDNDFFAKSGSLCWLLAFSVAASDVISQIVSLFGQLLLALTWQSVPIDARTADLFPFSGVTVGKLLAYLIPLLCNIALCVLTYAFADPRCGKRFVRYTLTGIFGIAASGVWFFLSWLWISTSGVFFITVGTFLLLLFSNTRLSDRILWCIITGMLLLFAVLRGILSAPDTIGEWFALSTVLSGYGKQLLYWSLIGIFRHRYNIRNS